LAHDNRLLVVLRTMNEIGICSVLDLYHATGISRPAIHRIVVGLCEQGYVERIPATSRFRLTSEVLALSAGYREKDWIANAGATVLGELQAEIQWPMSLATPYRDVMIVRETTRFRSPFVFDRGGVGTRLPMLRSSLGLAYLAFCEPKARAITMKLIASNDESDSATRNVAKTKLLLKETARRGYALRMGGIEAKTSSISVPVAIHGLVVGAICVTYATIALKAHQAAIEFVPPLRTAAARIAQIASGND
jgi:IclR family mhp operon transcriptional activator